MYQTPVPASSPISTGNTHTDMAAYFEAQAARAAQEVIYYTSQAALALRAAAGNQGIEVSFSSRILSPSRHKRFYPTKPADQVVVNDVEYREKPAQESQVEQRNNQ